MTITVTINYWLYLAMTVSFAGMLTVGMFKLIDHIESNHPLLPLPGQSIRRNTKRGKRDIDN